MIGKTHLMVAAVAATMMIVGCKNADDEFAPAFVPKTYAFEGKVEQKFVGNWSSTDGISKMDIAKDGTLSIDTTTRSMAGKAVTHVSGQWLSSGDSLMFRYSIGTQPQTVLKYKATLSGSTLTLQQEGGKAKVSYKRA